jgi:drug/metabolite transporter (DMT)-like permease
VRRNSNLHGILAMLAAVAFFSLMDAALKSLAPHYPPLQLAALRGGASIPFVTAWVLASVGPGALLRVRWPLHVLRGVLAIAMMSGFVYAVRVLPLSTAYSLFFVAPLLITALSVPVLGERVSARRWAAIGVGLAGVLVVLRPSPGGVLTVTGLVVLGAAASYAVSSVVVRVLARTDTTQSMVFWMVTMLAAGAGALAAPHWQPVQANHWLAIAGIGLAGALGQYAITEAFRRGEASAVAPFEYTALAWGLGLDALLWGALPGQLTLLGAAIIVLSGLYLIRREHVHAGAEHP